MGKGAGLWVPGALLEPVGLQGGYRKPVLAGLSVVALQEVDHPHLCGTLRGVGGQPPGLVGALRRQTGLDVDM